MSVESAARTDPGRDPDKQVNEDHYREGKTRLGFLAVVCDGMGGHAGGKEASALAAQTLFEEIEATGSGASLEGESPARALQRAIEVANRKVYALGQDGMHGRPGSTVVALLFHDQGVEVAHVGDSRIYLVRGVECMQITRDHSAVQLMVDAGVLTPEQAKVHPEANKITRALGIEPEVSVEVRPTPLGYAPGDTFLLCSDGLSDLLEPDDIVRLVGGVPLPQAAGQLVDLANARGGHDNITALLVRCKSAAGTVQDPRTQRMPPAGAGVAKTLINEPLAPPEGYKQPPRTIVMEPTPAPAAPHLPPPPISRPKSKLNPLVVLGIVVGVVVACVLAVMLVRHLKARAGAHHETGVNVPMPPVPAPVESLDPVEVPGEPPHDAAADDEEDEPLAPLNPDAGHSDHWRRWLERHRASSGQLPPLPPVPSPTPPPKPTRE